MKRSWFILFFSVLIGSLQAQQKDVLKIVAVGDIMLGTAYPDNKLLPKYNVQRLFEPLQSYLQNSDVCFGNLEGALTDDLSQVKECRTDGRCYCGFR